MDSSKRQKLETKGNRTQAKGFGGAAFPSVLIRSIASFLDIKSHFRFAGCCRQQWTDRYHVQSFPSEIPIRIGSNAWDEGFRSFIVKLEGTRLTCRVAFIGDTVSVEGLRIPISTLEMHRKWPIETQYEKGLKYLEFCSTRCPLKRLIARCNVWCMPVSFFASPCMRTIRVLEVDLNGETDFGSPTTGRAQGHIRQISKNLKALQFFRFSYVYGMHDVEPLMQLPHLDSVEINGLPSVNAPANIDKLPLSSLKIKDGSRYASDVAAVYQWLDIRSKSFELTLAYELSLYERLPSACTRLEVPEPLKMPLASNFATLLPRLQSLTVHLDPEKKANWFAALAQTKLVYLTINTARVATSSTYRSVEEWDCFPSSLAYLTIHGATVPSDLGRFVHLEHLCLERSEVRGTHLETLPELDSLELHSCDLTDGDRLPATLRRLVCLFTELKPAHLSRLTKLNYLDIEDAKNTFPMVQEIIHLPLQDFFGNREQKMPFPDVQRLVQRGIIRGLAVNCRANSEWDDEASAEREFLATCKDFGVEFRYPSARVLSHM